MRSEGSAVGLLVAVVGLEQVLSVVLDLFLGHVDPSFEGAGLELARLPFIGHGVGVTSLLGRG